MEITAQTYRKILSLTLPLPSLTPQLRFSFTFSIVLLIGLAVATLPLRIAVLLISSTIFLFWGLIRPEITLYLLVLIIPFSSLFAVTIAGVKIGGMELVLGFGLTGWFLRLVANSSTTGSIVINRGPLLWAFGMFLAGVSLSWLVTLSLVASLVETAKWIEMAVVYLFVINCLSWRRLPWVVGAIILAGLAQAIFGLYQFIFKVGPDGFLLFEGNFLRAYGTFAQPNPYGGYLGLVLPLTLSLTVWVLGSLFGLPLTMPTLGNWLKRFLKLGILCVPLGLMIAALYASQSRGAWLGFTFASLTTLVISSRRATYVVAATGFVGTMIILISSFSVTFSSTGSTGGDMPYNTVVQRVTDVIQVANITEIANTPVTDANFATLERLAHWQAAVEMWRDHPWLGVGFGNYAAAYPAYAIGRWEDPLGHAHNYMLNIGAEAGLVGITAYLIFWFSVFGLLWYILQRTGGFEKAVVSGIVGVVIHLHVHNLVDNLYVQGMYLHLAVFLGLASVVYQRSKTKTLGS
ncbi:MAG TPA: O-antigen ligase family protein [Anaerolineae bacterium]|nr:O-antigen ligase family protein [Anaerolineae bacterium]